MKIKACVLGAALLGLAGCDDFLISTGGSGSAFISELPESVLAIVGPYQDLNAVQIDPNDGCYVYQYVGPVETTFLPLRSKDGRPICTQLPEEEAPKKT